MFVVPLVTWVSLYLCSFVYSFLAATIFYPRNPTCNVGFFIFSILSTPFDLTMNIFQFEPRIRFAERYLCSGC